MTLVSMACGLSAAQSTSAKKKSTQNSYQFDTKSLNIKPRTYDAFVPSHNRNQVSFGYNVELNRRLIEKAEKSGKVFIAELAKLCNKVEDGIIRIEQTATQRDRFTQRKIDDIALKELMPTKKMLAESVEKEFPELEYTANESANYFDEAFTLEETQNIDPTWRAAMVDNLTPLNHLDQAQQVQQKSEFIKEFIPGPSSPRGFKDVAGMNDVKSQIKKWIVDPIKDPDLKHRYAAYGIKMPNGFLFHGVPGCGKTFIAEATAMEAGVPLYKLEISKLGSKFIHETSNNLKKAFEEIAQRAEESKKPCIIFIDEIDSIAQSRSKLSNADYKNEEIATLLQELNNVADKNVIVIAATNKKQNLDDAVIRTGRFSKHIFVGLPDQESRKDLLIKALAKKEKGVMLSKSEENIDKLAKDLEGFANSDIIQVVDDAAMIAFEKDSRIGADEIKEAIKQNEHLKKKDLSTYEEGEKPVKRKIGFIQ